uniref:FABP domain-containing protein n=1 Tax=Haemonchus contortus TaxID=6289 RepID=A0A7I5EE33_HAECO|nr:Fatty acid-binding protein 3 [Haemonchus contortus]
MTGLLFLLFVLGAPFAVNAKELPEKFYGKFDLDHSENFDEYLEAKGYGWFTRKLVTFATFKKEFKKSDKRGKFDYANLTSKKNVFYDNVELGKEFVGEGLDSTKHKIVFDLVGDVMFEKHHPIEEGEAKDETYEYSFITKDGKEYLLVKMEANGVIGKRFYKRV